MSSSRTPTKRRSGCGLLLAACFTTCVLLLVNRVFVTSVYRWVVPESLDYPRLRTVVQVLLIAALLLPEWWAIDRITRYLRNAVRAIHAPQADE